MDVNVKNNKIIWFDTPAGNWNEALPTGNGSFGGMVLGKPYVEYIQLNEDSVWSGGETDRNNPSAFENLAKIRDLIFKGKIKEAQELCAFALSGNPESQRHYEPLGNLYLLFAGGKNDFSNYKRELDISTGIIKTSFIMNGVRYTREVFTSYPHGVMVIRIISDKQGAVSFHTQLARGNPTWDYEPYQTRIYRNPDYNAFADKSYTIKPDISIMTGNCNGSGKLCAGLKVIAKSGTVKNIGNNVIVKNADDVTIILTACTTFRAENPEQSVVKKLEEVGQLNYNQLYESHLNDYTNLFNRVQLNLDIDKSESSYLPTNKRLDAFKKDVSDNSLIELLFNFGRYLLISSSRPNSLPANLQGIWNTDYNPAWGSKYTININTQMNYWLAENCNLSECHLPLFDHIKRMRKNGRKTAQVMYGCSGFAAHHNTDIWGDTAPQDVCLSSTYWVMGAAWLCLHIWEHYLFTCDDDFLREHYSLMRESSEFIIDYLIEDGGYLVVCPTLSPENEYTLQNGEKGVICKGASMDNQIIHELFNACINAAGILNTDKDFALLLSDVLKRIKKPSIGKHGQIMEWNEDYEETDIGHRHISQLFALHPGTQINLKTTPDLAIAALNTLKRRLSHGGGHTGWSRAWTINMWARLYDGDNALFHAKELLKKSTLPNLFDNHPPFQIDGNFGFTAGIAEMLLQSHNNEIVLLPALPNEWKNGNVNGLRARGGFEVNIVWKDNKLKYAEIVADKNSEAVIFYKDKSTVINLKKGERRIVE